MVNLKKIRKSGSDNHSLLFIMTTPGLTIIFPVLFISSYINYYIDLVKVRIPKNLNHDSHSDATYFDNLNIASFVPRGSQVEVFCFGIFCCSKVVKGHLLPNLRLMYLVCVKGLCENIFLNKCNCILSIKFRAKNLCLLLVSAKCVFTLLYSSVCG